MINSEVAVYNLALNAIGGRANVGAPDEASREAEVCRLWFTVVRDQILSAASWPEASAIANLALVSSLADPSATQSYTWQPGGFYTADPVSAVSGWTEGNPINGFMYKYALPPNTVQPQYLTSFDRFKIICGDNDQAQLMCNTPNAALVYTKQLETVSAWSMPLQMAIVYGLAGHICMPLTGKPSRAKQLIDQANSYIMNARENAANVSNEVFQAIPDWLLARGFIDTAMNSKFVYPYGQLLAVPTHVQ